MQGRFLHFLPLSVYVTNLGLSDVERQQIVDDIDQSQKDNVTKDSISSWTGDLHGHHELHSSPVYNRLFSLLGEQIRQYVLGLKIDEKYFDFYFTRSWGTKQTINRKIEYHRHLQSHISAVYYARVPDNSGDFYVATDDHQNEIIPGLFREDNYAKGVVKYGCQFTMAELPIEVDDDMLLLFPSKTAHRTGVSQTKEPRYSVAIDIMCALKDASRFEIGLTPVHSWRKV